MRGDEFDRDGGIAGDDSIEQMGSLAWAAGEVPTPYGVIAVKWGVSARGAVSMNVTVPNGTTGTIAIPSGATVTVNGKAVTTSASSALDARASDSDGGKYGYIDNVQPGVYVIESANPS